MNWIDRLNKAVGECDAAMDDADMRGEQPPWAHSSLSLEQRLKFLAPALEQAQGKLAMAEHAYTNAMAFGDTEKAEKLNAARAMAASELKRIQEAQAEILAQREKPSIPLIRRR
jgi:hypothetical protein